MDLMANATEDTLIDGLSYKLGAGSSYITDRRSVTYYQQGSNIYTNSSGTKVLRILINGDSWLDPSTVKLFFDVRNNDTTASHILRVLSGPYSFFRRARLMVANQLVEDIDYYNFVHHMFDSLRSRYVRENEDCEGFETRYDQPDFQNIVFDNQNAYSTTFRTELYGAQMQSVADKYISVIGGQSKTVSFKPLFGLLNCGKLINLKYAPLTFEFELTPNATDVIMSVNELACNINVDGNATYNGGTINTSLVWQIENPSVKCDVVTLDNSLENEYHQLLLSGKSLPINYSTFITQLQTITAGSPAINITRALSRLKSVFVRFDNVGTVPTNNQNVHLPLYKKYWNDFYHPMTNTAGYSYDSAYEMEYHLQVGSHVFPDYPIRSVQEAFYQLRKCMGIHNSNFHSIDITPAQYRSHKFILAFDLEKNLGSSFTGLNIKNGQMITLKTKAIGSSVTGTVYPDTCYVVLHADCILSIRDSGVEVFE